MVQQSACALWLPAFPSLAPKQLLHCVQVPPHPDHGLTHGWLAARSCDVPTSRPALERAEGVPWGLIPQLWYDDAKVPRSTCPVPQTARGAPDQPAPRLLMPCRPASSGHGSPQTAVVVEKTVMPDHQLSL